MGRPGLGPRGRETGPDNGAGERDLGCSTHPQRACEARHRGGHRHGREAHAAAEQASLADLASVSREPLEGPGGDRLLQRDPLPPITGRRCPGASGRPGAGVGQGGRVPGSGRTSPSITSGRRHDVLGAIPTTRCPRADGFLGKDGTSSASASRSGLRDEAAAPSVTVSATSDGGMRPGGELPGSTATQVSGSLACSGPHLLESRGPSAAPGTSCGSSRAIDVHVAKAGRRVTAAPGSLTMRWHEVGDVFTVRARIQQEVEGRVSRFLHGSSHSIRYAFSALRAASST